MRRISENYFHDVISGRKGGIVAGGVRAALTVAEPVYAAATAARNWLYDAGWSRSRSAGRPVVCVGNITTGGTGKTPVVHWLADALRRRRHRPAVLMRGYKGDAQGASDEQRLLEQLLSEPAEAAVPVIANPDRLEGARRALHRQPAISVFVLDDGFQHRRLRRDFDLVLIDASNPFGHRHLLPRGLLRESLQGLRRATAMLLTHVECTAPGEIPEVERLLRAHNPWAPLYRAQHAHRGLLAADGTEAADDLAGRRCFAFCGIGNPAAFLHQLERSGGTCLGHHVFADHHAYTGPDLSMLQHAARARGAELLVTTEKDWVKVEQLREARVADPPIWRVRLGLDFIAEDGQRLVEQVLSVIGEVKVERGDQVESV
jgi:tetraacyldisaccharide 4'-kinase